MQQKQIPLKKSSQGWNTKQAGVIHTPKHIVNFMLDKLLPPSLKDLHICEPACGDGPFLKEVVRRICNEAKESKKPKSYIPTFNHITGFDIDEDSIRECKKALYDICKKSLGEEIASSVNWKIHNIDILDSKSWESMIGKFDYVAGNPPYVRIQHLENIRRVQVSLANWKLAKGSTDLYFLFFEAGLKFLKKTGVLSYITPSSWIRSASGNSFREILKTQYRLEHVTDFGDHQVFPNATVYTAITSIKNQSPDKSIIPAARASVKSDKVIYKDGYSIDLKSNNWSISSKKERSYFIELESTRTQLKDIADVSVGIQTLADKVFILNLEGKRDTKTYWCSNHDRTEVFPVEIGSIRRINKASIKNKKKQKQTKVIIYPYQKGSLITEDDLFNQYPYTSDWLLVNKDYLLLRDKGKLPYYKWYGYGREVAITSGFGKKILTPSMAKYPSFSLYADTNSLFYSGYSIKPKKHINYPQLLEELNSENMYRFIKLFSKPYQNGWFSYAKSIIKSFPISIKVQI